MTALRLHKLRRLAFEKASEISPLGEAGIVAGTGAGLVGGAYGAGRLIGRRLNKASILGRSAPPSMDKLFDRVMGYTDRTAAGRDWLDRTFDRAVATSDRRWGALTSAERTAIDRLKDAPNKAAYRNFRRADAPFNHASGKMFARAAVPFVAGAAGLYGAARVGHHYATRGPKTSS